MWGGGGGGGGGGGCWAAAGAGAPPTQRAEDSAGNLQSTPRAPAGRRSSSCPGCLPLTSWRRWMGSPLHYFSFFFRAAAAAAFSAWPSATSASIFLPTSKADSMPAARMTPVLDGRWRDQELAEVRGVVGEGGMLRQRHGCTTARHNSGQAGEPAARPHVAVRCRSGKPSLSENLPRSCLPGASPGVYTLLRINHLPESPHPLQCNHPGGLKELRPRRLTRRGTLLRNHLGLHRRCRLGRRLVLHRGACGAIGAGGSLNG